MTGDGVLVPGIEIDCIHCGTYTVTVDQARSLKHTTLSDGIICFRCDDEANCLIQGKRAIRADDWRNAIKQAGV